MLQRFFKHSRALNHRHQANQGFKFLILNGMGVTVYQLSPGKQEFHLHVPHHQTLLNWFRTDREVHQNGYLKLPHTALPVPYPVTGTKLCLQYEDGHASHVMTVDAVFTQRHLTDRFTPNILRNWLSSQDNADDLYTDVTYKDEVYGYTLFIHTLFRHALQSGSWTIATSSLFKSIGVYSVDIFNNWLDDLVRAQLVTAGSTQISIQNSLLYLMMNSINKHNPKGRVLNY